MSGPTGGVNARAARWVGTCARCGKTCFPSRKEARSAARKVHPGEKMSAYRCGSYFHYGHNEVWRDLAPDDLVWQPLPVRARHQLNEMRLAA